MPCNGRSTESVLSQWLVIFTCIQNLLPNSHQGFGAGIYLDDPNLDAKNYNRQGLTLKYLVCTPKECKLGPIYLTYKMTK